MRTTQQLLTVTITMLALIGSPFTCVQAQEYYVPEDEARQLAAVSFIEHIACANPFLNELREGFLDQPTLIHDPSGEPLVYEFRIGNDETVGHILIGAHRMLGTIDLRIEKSSMQQSWAESIDQAVPVFYAEFGTYEILDVAPVVYAYPDQGIMITYFDDMVELEKTVVIDRFSLEIVAPTDVVSFFESLDHDQINDRLEKWEFEFETKFQLMENLTDTGVFPEVVFDRALDPMEYSLAHEVVTEMGSPILKTVDLSNLKLSPAGNSYFSRQATLQMIYNYDHGYLGPFMQWQIDQNLNWYHSDWKDPKAALKSFIRAFPWSLSSSDYMNIHETNLMNEIDNGRPFIELLQARRGRMVVAYKVTDYLPGSAYPKSVYTGYYDPLPTGYGTIGFEKTFKGNLLVVKKEAYLTAK